MYSYVHVEYDSNRYLKQLCDLKYLVYHVVNFNQLFYLLCFHVYKSYHSIFLYHIYILVRFQMHVYVILFHQDSFYQDRTARLH